MAFGVLESRQHTRPKGTTLVRAVEAQDDPATVDHPPLNGPGQWSRTRRELAFVTVVFGCCATGVIGPLLVPGFTIVAQDLSVALEDVTLLNGVLVMALGVSAYICNALATTYGTRLIYLFTTLSLVATCCWGAAAQSYRSLLTARVVQGLGMGGWFALAGTTSLTQMFPVQQRGRRVGIWNFAVIVSINTAPVISGRVITALGWRWAFWLLAITFGVAFGMTALLFPETSGYTPNTITITTTTTTSTALALNEEQKWRDQSATTHGSEVKSAPTSTDDFEATESQAETGKVFKPVPVWKRIAGVENIHMGTVSQTLKALIAPIALLQNPAVIWGCLMWTVTFTWVIIQGAVASQIWGSPPYELSPSSVGIVVGVPPLIGSALGCLIGGFACDWLGNTLARHNGHLYEPEFRLLVVLPATVAAVLGIFGLGEAIERQMSVTVTAVFLCILNFAVGLGCTVIVAYTNDTCQERAGEAFGLAMVIKSAFAFGLTFMLNDYYAANGARKFFATWGGLTIGVMLLTVPMYIWGKQSRAWAR